jgi:hypothetical protein
MKDTVCCLLPTKYRMDQVDSNGEIEITSDNKRKRGNNKRE